MIWIWILIKAIVIYYMFKWYFTQKIVPWNKIGNYSKKIQPISCELLNQTHTWVYLTKIPEQSHILYCKTCGKLPDINNEIFIDLNELDKQ